MTRMVVFSASDDPRIPDFQAVRSVARVDESGSVHGTKLRIRDLPKTLSTVLRATAGIGGSAR